MTMNGNGVWKWIAVSALSILLGSGGATIVANDKADKKEVEVLKEKAAELDKAGAVVGQRLKSIDKHLEKQDSKLDQLLERIPPR